MPLASVEAVQAMVIDVVVEPLVDPLRARTCTDGADGPTMSTAYAAFRRRPDAVRPSSRLVLLTPELINLLRRAAALSFRAGLSWRTIAATPATWGAANDVPGMNEYVPGHSF